MNYVDIGIFFRMLREEKEISQETAAAVVGISDRTLRNIETGETHADTHTLFKLCDLYGISGYEIWLFYERDEDMTEAMLIYHIQDAHRTEELLPV